MIGTMADRDRMTKDSAFLWETEALRSTAPRTTPAPPPRRSGSPGSDWLTLREANEQTGIPISTLRKWARREAIPTYMQETATGQLRMVSLKAVKERAMSLGREDEPTPPVTPPEAAPATTATPAAFGPPPQAGPQPEPPPGTMIVPIDAWDKMLLQLGNLHEAGQQLAEARERAAKAETEARFLKERLAELRSDLVEARSAQAPTARYPLREEEPSEPISHIPIESSEDEPETEPEDEFEIPVRDLDRERAEQPNPEAPFIDDGEMTLAEYSLEMMRHIYSTWRGRPRR